MQNAYNGGGMLERIISSRARTELLNILLLHGDGRFYLRELARLTGLPLGSIQRELANLVSAGVLLRERGGRQTYYRVNERCQIIPELRSTISPPVSMPPSSLVRSREALKDLKAT